MSQSRSFTLRTIFTTAAVVAVFVLDGGSLAQAQGDPTLTEVWEPEPSMVIPGASGGAPSDAVVLFDGTDLSAWESQNGSEAAWVVDADAGIFTVDPDAGDIVTKQGFGDVQLHVEWRTPAVVRGRSQNRGNSGVYLQSLYEVQVLDSYENPTYVNGQAGAIYKQHIPLVNASRAPGTWQTYDIIFMAPRFGADGSVERPATMTVLHNGILIQNHAVLTGASANVGEATYEAHGPLPLLLQDHDHPVSYRNIWLREL
ncbi:MAG: DUF1080 domain-containing protein [Vicinamibacterales bacterium]|jgi:hypothetical protein|nr:hypothetical protein [Acidobacteriota bacterium]MDP7295338.1 DUF1080 domain-containing protein [Vicinamibacterales bacterium]MDP7472407.1 DUF1080 domain-containing protein [Vicinamibacterales bacterium]MDP7670397.1 DUF1080 domain-containing protein [Vicinamibacterales bacterium]HJO38054.1 DUF1080 domain-containing protein [Vicinamibacterales bacterium]|tara:strand:- start:7531 stop:8301 length:771 start_codon:yes stop_codon:yes gene_type:complete